MIKTFVATAAVLAAAGTATAEESSRFPGTFSANVALGSDYVFRGISQTDENPTIQGGFDWSMEAGAVSPYLGVWASNVDFNVDETLELDVYGGLTGEFAGVSWDIGLTYYMYPGSGPDYDFLEVEAGLEYAPHDMVTLGAAYAWSPDFFWSTGDAHYLSGSLSLTPGLPYDIAFFGGVGRQWIENNARFGTPDYMDWTIGVSATWERFTLSVAYVDTDLGRNDCFGGADLCGARAVATLSAAF